MYRLLMYIQSGLHQRFRESRMDSHDMSQILGCPLKFHNGGSGKNDITGMRTEYMDSQNLVSLGIGDDLGETIGSQRGYSFTDRSIREIADFDLTAFSRRG